MYLNKIIMYFIRFQWLCCSHMIIGVRILCAKKPRCGINLLTIAYVSVNLYSPKVGNWRYVFPTWSPHSHSPSTKHKGPKWKLKNNNRFSEIQLSFLNRKSFTPKKKKNYTANVSFLQGTDRGHAMHAQRKCGLQQKKKIERNCKTG